jgi:hypothetical protein
LRRSAGLLLLATSGIEFKLDPIDPDERPPHRVAVTETFVQSPLPRADLLLVVDDTASMAQEQQALAAELGGLLDELDRSGVGWQLGVVTTDMGTDEAGWLEGQPWVLVPSTEDRDAAFAAMVQVGTAGSGPEAGLAAAVTALELSAPGGPNAGFRRPDALLHVVFVSDADDSSEAWLGSDPAGAFLDRLSEEAATTGLPARASGLYGPVPSGCVSADGTATAAFRYDGVVHGSGGVGVSICAPDLGPVIDTLSEATIAWRTVFALRESPLPGTVHVEIDGVPSLDDWSVEGDPAAVRFDPAPPAESVIVVTYVVEA